MKKRINKIIIPKEDLRLIYGGGKEYTNAQIESAQWDVEFEFENKIKFLKSSIKKIQDVSLYLEKENIYSAYRYVAERRSIFIRVREAVSHGFSMLFSCMPIKKRADVSVDEIGYEKELTEIIQFVQKTFEYPSSSIHTYIHKFIPPKLGEKIPKKIRYNKDLVLDTKNTPMVGSLKFIREKEKELDNVYKRCMESVKKLIGNQYVRRDIFAECLESSGFKPDISQMLFGTIDSGSETVSPSGSTGILTPRDVVGGHETNLLLAGAARAVKLPTL